MDTYEYATVRLTLGGNTKSDLGPNSLTPLRTNLVKQTNLVNQKIKKLIVKKKRIPTFYLLLNTSLQSSHTTEYRKKTVWKLCAEAMFFRQNIGFIVKID